MELKLHTYDIQHLIIALIVSQGKTCCEESDRERLLDTLNGLNSLCTEANNYTLKVTIEA